MPDRHATLKQPTLVALGFKYGERGMHTSRTMMLRELAAVLDAVPTIALKDEYRAAVQTENVLAKKTVSTRRLTWQRLTELYALDPSVTLFRILRVCWDWDRGDRTLLALLCALARDPLLRLTANAVLSSPQGSTVTKSELREVLDAATHGRLNAATVDKVVRNTASSWTQSGHLQGRVRKIRSRPAVSSTAAVYAMLLGYLEGSRGAALFESQWARVLDVSSDELRRLLSVAARAGRLTYQSSGNVADIRFDGLLTKRELELTRESH